MTVKELIEKLMLVEDKGRVVVLAIDPEGNAYSEASDGIWECRFNEAEESVGFESLTEEQRREGYSDDDIMEDGVPALVLWP